MVFWYVVKNAMQSGHSRKCSLNAKAVSASSSPIT